MGTCGRVWGHVAGVVACDKGYGHLAGEGLGHVAGCGVMWQGVRACGMGWICENMTNVKKSKMLTMNEVHKNFNFTQ